MRGKSQVRWLTHVSGAIHTRAVTEGQLLETRSPDNYVTA